ncbi:Fc.00g015960.m01.CDS01 [Cosmosporella sp. VM-42]
MADSELRLRKPLPEEVHEPKREHVEDADEIEDEPPKKIRKVKKSAKSNSPTIDDEDDDSPWLDVLRVLTFLFLASCALSYTISGGETFFWGMKQKPDYLRVDYWKERLQGPPPPVYLTLDELAAYDGTDAEKPLYLAINGTIYDVSAGSRIYGPGGSYHYFAGCDAARAYVTGCFSEDRTADMRGVEDMYLPVDDAEVDSHWSEEELAEIKAQELKDAHKQVHDALKHWVDFFARSKKYEKVGYLKREDGWLEKEPLKPLCKPAQNGREKRKPPTNESN